MRRRRAIAVASLTIAALALSGASSGAVAATVVNGDFESGTLDGWHVQRAKGAGNWFAYRDGVTPISKKRGTGPVPAPPEGSFAAITDELNPDTLILYQDVTLGAGSGQRLSLLAFYESSDPIAVPGPDTLSVEDEVLAGQRNQQFRIDVMRPGAPLESVDPADVLLTVFRTKPGDPRKLQPKRLTADLTAFAGQTVRLRVAVAAHEELLNAGIDDVSISGSGGSKSGGSARFGIRRRQADRNKGTVMLRVRVPGPGLLEVKGKSVKAVAAKAAKEGTVGIRLRLKRSAMPRLRRRHALRTKVTVDYLPANEPGESKSLPVTFRLTD